MSGLSPSLLSKNAPIWRTSLTPKSPRRSANRRLNSPCSRTSKTWGLRHNTNNDYARTPNQGTQLPIHYFCPLGGYYNRVHLFTPNRPKITHRLLISKPHGPGGRGYPYPNTLRLYWSTHLNNRPRPHILRPFLFSEH